MKSQQNKFYVLMVVCFLLLGTVFAVAQLQTSKEVKVETSEDISAKDVKVVEISRIPHLEFSVTTPQSDLLVTKLKTRVVGYDKEGNTIAGSIRILCTDVSKDSKLDSLLAINPDLASAERYFVQITSTQSSQSKEIFQ